MKNVFALTLLVLLVSCKDSIINDKVEIIKAEASGDQNFFFSEFVKDIEMVPLDNEEEAFLSDSPELVVYNTNYYIFNRRLSLEGASISENILLNFDSKGKLLGYIGDNGVGSGKYIGVKNFCISRDTIYIFSSPDFVINKFKLNGEFIEKKAIPYKSFMQAFKFEDEYLLYLNLNTGVRNERLVIMNEQGKEISAYLPIKTKACPWTENNSLSLNFDNNVLIREFYNDTIYSFSTKKGVIPRLVVDFAEKSIPKKNI